MEALTLLMGAGRAGVGGRVSQIAQDAGDMPMLLMLAKAKKTVRKCILVVNFVPNSLQSARDCWRQQVVIPGAKNRVKL